MLSTVRALFCVMCGLGPRALASQAAPSPALPTKLEATADTIFARVLGNVPVARVHRLVQEVSIAPGAEDTTLFTQVNGFQVDRAGRFWVFDSPTSSIFLFGKDGALIKRIGRRGGGPGELQSDNGSVLLKNDRFAIWDARNARISWFAADGSFERSTLVSTGFYTFNGLFTDQTGAVLIELPVTARREGGRLGALGLIRIRDDGSLGDTLVPPNLGVQIAAYTASKGGASATYSSRNSPSAGWAWHPNGFFVTVDGAKSRILLARKSAKPVVIDRRLPDVRISADERADDQAWVTWGLRQTVPDWKWTGPAVPDTKSAFGGLFTARDGRIWVRVATPSERIPDSELPERRPKGAPTLRFRSPIAWEVYASDGGFLARVAFPQDTQLMQADDNTVWALGRDADDLPAVRRYRVQPALPKSLR